MDELIKEIVVLIDKLERANSPEGSAEQITLSHLRGLMTALEHTVAISELKPGVLDLEQFWLSSVAWCSQLSKDIEKIIIIYQELL
jgi:hypothetical protein